MLYCVFLLVNGLGTLYIAGNDSPLYIVGQILSTLFAIGFFFFYYGVIPSPPDVRIPAGMLAWILYQEIWANRRLYDLISVEGLPQEQRRQLLIFIPMIFILFLAPFVWIVIQVFKAYFL